MKEYAKIKKYAQKITEKIGVKPEIAIILGSGLKPLADDVKIIYREKYANIKGFPVTTVSGHNGELIIGRLSGKIVAIFSGRIHVYEGYSSKEVVKTVVLAKFLGAKTLFLTNSAGAINPNFSVGDLMVITGHISTFIESPLIGENDENLGPRFPDMTEVYNKNLIEKIYNSAERIGVKVESGVYLQVKGPNYETPEEIGFFEKIGADAVGMSTAVEALMAHYLGLNVCGISLITNLSPKSRKNSLTHEEVRLIARKNAEKFKSLIEEFLKN